ncbi:glycosyltransferase [Rhodoplanes azumiensis]|uniref:Glycosyltransferase n=1 Tax=Rhodoplanes azumiensis TaxID=1897628 RepID=A0ABW5AF97_9BRAD
MRSVAAVVALVVCLHAGAWAIWQSQSSAPNVSGPLTSVSYSPFEGHPEEGNRPTTEQIRNDLKVLSPYTRAIRTYSATGGAELVPPVAAEFGLKVAVGAWLDGDTKRNEREIKSVVDLYRKNRNINAIVVGNEAIYRADFKKKTESVDGATVTRELSEKEQVGELIRYIQQVKREVGGNVPVTTGEIYSTWLNHPELASAVDFIAVHILPYWEGFSAGETVDLAINNYFKLREAFPGKRIVIAEFGWPSAGYNRRAAEPGREIQASLLRDFVARAEALGIDYNIIEAFDQPWKTFEGSVGAYWGLFDAARQPKFAWTGPVYDPAFVTLAVVAVVASLVVSLPILFMTGATLLQALTLAVFANIVGAWTGVVWDYWSGHYFVMGQAIALGIGVLLMIPLVIIAMWKIDEIAQVLFGRGPQRLVRAGANAPEGFAPKVSIHVPAYYEQPEMLKATLDSVARLDYPNFECVVAINNTTDPAYTDPIEAHCRLLGDRFKFLNLQNVKGFKAGALRIAMQHTAPDAEIIGLIDADYTVTPDWLKDLVPAFADPQVGLVQAPQDHRDGEKSPLHQIMNGEYAGFFDIGMVQRNEVDAIVTHGTMCLIRRAAMDDAGGWSSDTICEDTDLGLTIYEQGWRALYTNRRYGHGLLPDTFEAFKKQRHRWAYGGFQIAKKHWRRFLPGMSNLTAAQRREFLLGWMNWMGAESLGVVVAMLNLLWVPVVAFVGIAIPDKVLTIPILAASVVSILHFTTLYRSRVKIGPLQATGAMLAAMAMQWTVAKAVGTGLIKDHLPFVVTAKGGKAKKRVSFPAFDEAVFGALLLIGAVIVWVTNHESVREVNLFAIVLVVQSLPFLSAVALAGLEGSPLNDYAVWRNLQARTAELLGLAPPQPATGRRAEPAITSDKAAEPAQ